MPKVSLAEFVAAAQAGDLVSFPTDTVPALACRPDRSEHIFSPETAQPNQTSNFDGRQLGRFDALP